MEFPIRRPIKKENPSPVPYSDESRDYNRKGRSSTLEILQKLKSQEDKPVAKLESFSSVDDFQRKKKASVTQPTREAQHAKDPTETEIENVMDEMERLDRRMKHGDSYLNLYYDMKRMEEIFLKKVADIERSNIEISDVVLRRINTKKKFIKNKTK